MTLNIGDLKLDSLGFVAVLFLQATFTYAVSGFWPLKKLGWYRNWSAAISVIPLGHSLISAQPDLLKVSAAVLGALIGVVASTWIAEKSDRTGKFFWSLSCLILVSMIVCLSDMKGSTPFFCGVLVSMLANMAIKACRKSKDNEPKPENTGNFAVPISRPASQRNRPRRILLSDGSEGMSRRRSVETSTHIPASRLNWHPRNN